MNTCRVGRICASVPRYDFIFSPVGKQFCIVLFLFAAKISPGTTSHLEIIQNIKLINENTTILFPEMNSTANSTVSENNADQAKLDSYPWWCKCSNELEENQNESECHCEGQKLTKIPQNLAQITRLSIANAKFKVLREAGLRKYSSSLRDLFLTNLDDFYQIESTTFKNIVNLRTIYISHAPKLQYISSETFRHISKSFKTLRIINCGLREIPDMRDLSAGILLQLDFEGNQIAEILENSIRIKTEQLILDNNALTAVQKAAFNGSEIGKLSMKGNSKLKILHEFAFEGIINIRQLDLSSTSIESLPSTGLDKLEELRIQNTHSLKQIPSVYNFKNLEKAWLTHSFHCCAFKFPSRHDPMRHTQQLELFEKFKFECETKGYHAPMESGKTTTADGLHPVRRKRSWWRRWIRSSNISSGEVAAASHQYDEPIGDNSEDPFGNMGFFHEPKIAPNDYLEAICGNLTLTIKNVKCYPAPDELNPCEDVMGSEWLRGSVWIVVTLTVSGNVCVLVVLFSNRSELTVPKFLMCNLALADFSMGLYLLFIASIDLHSMGEYFNFAFDWQYGIGCKTAGFLTVFAGHLSIFTLTIITVERWFAITHAIYLNKRLKFNRAVLIMVCGWIYSICMAALPLFGISNYSSTSICLPMEARDLLDITYLITVLAVNGLGFFIVVICYAQIYFSLGTETRTRSTNSGEMTVAKKMALLVFTNFACWAPIAFFGLTALAGYPLIDVTKSKILLVFFYPINSCANPFLYAILTAQFRRDFFLLLAKLGICTQRAQQYKMNFSLPTHVIQLQQLANRASNNSNHFYKRSNGSNPNEGLLLPSDSENGNGKPCDVHV